MTVWYNTLQSCGGMNNHGSSYSQQHGPSINDGDDNDEYCSPSSVLERRLSKKSRGQLDHLIRD